MLLMTRLLSALNLPRREPSYFMLLMTRLLSALHLQTCIIHGITKKEKTPSPGLGRTGTRRMRTAWAVTVASRVKRCWAAFRAEEEDRCMY
jgi:hypothetical protein